MTSVSSRLEARLALYSRNGPWVERLVRVAEEQERGATFTVLGFVARCVFSLNAWDLGPGSLPG